MLPFMSTEAWQYPIRPQAWPELQQFYDDLAVSWPEMSYLARIVFSVTKSGVAERLGAITSMHDLVVAPTPVEEPPVEVIIVRAPGSVQPPSKGAVRIVHLAD